MDLVPHEVEVVPGRDGDHFEASGVAFDHLSVLRPIEPVEPSRQYGSPHVLRWRGSGVDRLDSACDEKVRHKRVDAVEHPAVDRESACRGPSRRRSA